MEFRWIEWNQAKVATHGVTPDEAMEAVRTARSPYPEKSFDGRWLVLGQTAAGRFIQVAFLVDEDGTVFVSMRGRLKNGKRSGCGEGGDEESERQGRVCGQDHRAA